MQIISHIEVIEGSKQMCLDNKKHDALAKECLRGLDSSEESLDVLSCDSELEDGHICSIDQNDADEVRTLTNFIAPELDTERVEAALDAVNAKIDAVGEGEKGVEMS